jgi:hypothetical protein
VSDIASTFDEFDNEDDVGTEAPTDAELAAETPEADAAEQHTELLQYRDVPITERPPEADPADVAEQRRVVKLDEDDYR